MWKFPYLQSPNLLKSTNNYGQLHIKSRRYIFDYFSIGTPTELPHSVQLPS